jgi:hypothetical protein
MNYDKALFCLVFFHLNLISDVTTAGYQQSINFHSGTVPELASNMSSVALVVTFI